MDIRTRILEAAVRVFGETGYRGATTRRIAQVAEVNEVTLFRHFGSKDELLRVALQQVAAAEDDVSLPDEPSHPERELTQWARAQHKRLVHMAPVIRTCMGESEERPEMAKCAQNQPARVAADLRMYLSKLQKRGLADAQFDVGTATAMLLGTLFNDAIGRAFMPELFSHSAEQAPARYVKLFVRAIGATDITNTTPSKARAQ